MAGNTSSKTASRDMHLQPARLIFCFSCFQDKWENRRIETNQTNHLRARPSSTQRANGEGTFACSCRQVHIRAYGSYIQLVEDCECASILEANTAATTATTATAMAYAVDQPLYMSWQIQSQNKHILLPTECHVAGANVPHDQQSMAAGEDGRTRNTNRKTSPEHARERSHHV